MERDGVARRIDHDRHLTDRRVHHRDLHRDAFAFELRRERDDGVALTTKLQGEGVTVKIPVMDTPVCQMSVVIDPAGNAVTLHQLKRKT